MNAEQKASREKKLRELQERWGYTFRDRGLLERALCHSSYSRENGHGPHESYERLEFLGDAVLELTISHLLFDFYEYEDEGHLTQERSKLVCERSLAKLSKTLKLEDLILRGKSIRKAPKSPIPDSIYADVLEAILGALYIDGGYEEAARAVCRLFAFHADVTKTEPLHSGGDPKSRLQAMTQAKKINMPEYKTILIEGPHHSPTFKVRVLVDGKEWFGEGSSKKAAEARAADKALNALLPREAEKSEDEKSAESLFSRLVGFLKRK